jgi:hypothetical protein
MAIGSSDLDRMIAITARRKSERARRQGNRQSSGQTQVLFLPDQVEQMSILPDEVRQ